MLSYKVDLQRATQDVVLVPDDRWEGARHCMRDSWYYHKPPNKKEVCVLFHCSSLTGNTSNWPAPTCPKQLCLLLQSRFEYYYSLIPFFMCVHYHKPPIRMNSPCLVLHLPETQVTDALCLVRNSCVVLYYHVLFLSCVNYHKQPNKKEAWVHCCSSLTGNKSN